MKKLFWSQPKIIDQSHCFQLWAKLRNAAPVRGFITTSNSQLLLYNTDSCVPLRVLRNFCLYSIQSGEALDKNKQTNIFCQMKAFNTSDHVILFKKVRWCSVTGQLIDWFPNYPDHRELWLTAQPQSVYWSLPVYPRAVMLAHFSWRNSSMTFLMLPSIKRAPPHMSMIPKCTTYFKNEGVWYSRAGSDEFEHPELWNKY